VILVIPLGAQYQNDRGQNCFSGFSERIKGNASANLTALTVEFEFGVPTTPMILIFVRGCQCGLDAG
jgi:hypothetical protein